MLLSQLPSHLRAQAEAERERQRPGSTEDWLTVAFVWHKSPQGYCYWRDIEYGPVTYSAEDVEALVETLAAVRDFLTDAGSGNIAAEVDIALATFKSKHPGV